MKRTTDLPQRPPPVVGFGDHYAAGFVDQPHTHDRGQVSVILAGTVTINTDEGSFALQPNHGIWIPPGTLHQAICRIDTLFQVVYVDPGFAGVDLSTRMFEASALLRGLVDEIVAMRFDFTMDDRMSTIGRLLIDEIGRAPWITDRLPFPADYRLRRVCEMIVADPGDSHDLDFWAREAGMARRTFTRLFQLELGMGFAAWRRRVRVTEAASRIVAGQSIAEVAFDLGYDNASSFSMMFHRTFGAPPRTLRSARTPPSRP